MEKIELDNGKIILYLGDCLELMPRQKPGIIDLILADLPYGATRNKWDNILPLDILWKEYKRLRKSNAAIVLTAQTPFDKVLGVSNLEELKYEWIWEKPNASGHLNAKKMPMKAHENVLVFYKNLPVYNPQFQEGTPYISRLFTRGDTITSTNYNSGKAKNDIVNDGYRYPRSVILIKNGNYTEGASGKRKSYHPTQKPVALMEYLVKTYTNENDLVMDNTMGSGTTAVACINTNRRFVGIEKEEKYFEIAVNRCKEAIEKKV